ncbi:hypothetical protein EVAR_93018_1 [Eumeta japonica]|uniref:Uncharacterized protein n=1 Tax=Eumeta variegata TaxID=151549 RepID=A0A4C1SHH2_EUMVA|nr:hypothetical protein EVAR_93018_1 [Eumeta japonica]
MPQTQIDRQTQKDGATDKAPTIIPERSPLHAQNSSHAPIRPRYFHGPPGGSSRREKIKTGLISKTNAGAQAYTCSNIYGPQYRGIGRAHLCHLTAYRTPPRIRHLLQNAPTTTYFAATRRAKTRPRPELNTWKNPRNQRENVYPDTNF